MLEPSASFDFKLHRLTAIKYKLKDVQMYEKYYSL